MYHIKTHWLGVRFGLVPFFKKRYATQTFTRTLQKKTPTSAWVRGYIWTCAFHDMWYAPQIFGHTNKKKDSSPFGG